MKRLTALAITMVLVITACGEGDSSTTETTTATPAATTEDTSATETTVNEATGNYSFGARLDGDGLEWVWTGAFSIVGDQLVGNGTVTGSADTTCSIGDGPEYPIVYTGAGTYDITGTAEGSRMWIVLNPTGGDVDVTTGDASQLCVEVSIDISEVLAQFPMGNLELTEVPLTLPIEGGITGFEFGGFFFDVMVSTN